MIHIDNYNTPKKCPGSGMSRGEESECPQCGFIWTRVKFNKVPDHGLVTQAQIEQVDPSLI